MSHQLEGWLTASVALVVGLLSLLGVAEPRAVSAATLTVLALIAFRMTAPRPSLGTRLRVTYAEPTVDAFPAMVDARVQPGAYGLLVIDLGTSAGMIAIDVRPIGADR